MLSRLLKSAKSYISENPKTAKKISPKRAAANEHHHTMVTPRRSRSKTAAEQELTAENSNNVYVPTSSANKRKERAGDEDMSDNDEFVTPMSKKRKLPVRGKGVKSPKASQNMRPVVEITTKVIAPEELDFVEEDEEAGSEEEAEAEAEAEEPKLPVITPSKHHRFASEEPEQEFFSTAREQVSPTKEAKEERVVHDSEEDEESDDEAPEAIGAQDAENAVKAKAREAAQAVKEQQLAARQKRKEREENLKKQSENIKKRKIVPDLLPLEIPSTDDEDDHDEDAAPGDAVDVAEEESMTLDNSPTISHKRPGFDLRRTALPQFLPAEYLEDSDPRELVLHETVVNERTLSRKTKFKDLVEKQPKDKRVGSTTYRVTKARSTILAPKSAYQARSVKESWLKGRSGNAVGVNRKPFSGGFLRK